MLTNCKKGLYMNKLSLRKITKSLFLFTTLFLTSLNSQASLIFINEIHYDNIGADSGEFVELAGTSGFNLLNWSLLFYNGNNGSLYKTVIIGDIALTNAINGFGFHSLDVSGIQNGSSAGIGDGIALVDNFNNLQQFISYEGVFRAIDGAASGIDSQDINISQSSSPLGKSLQLSGVGINYQDFTWVLANQTSGNINTKQNFIKMSADPIFKVDEPSSYLLFLVAGIILISNKRRAKRPLRNVCLTFDCKYELAKTNR